MKEFDFDQFDQLPADYGEFIEFPNSTITSSPTPSSESEVDCISEIDTSNNIIDDVDQSSPVRILSNDNNVSTLDSLYSNNELEQTNNEANPLIMSDEQQNDPLRIDHYISKIERCSFCNKKKYYYDLILLKRSIRDKSNAKICLNCALDTIDDKRIMRDVEFKCSRKNMIKPYQCKKCHAYRSIFRFKLNKNNELQYCFFCAKKKYFTLHKRNHRNCEYVSYLEKVYGDPEKRND